MDLVGGDDLAELGGHPDRSAGVAAADRLRQADHVGLDAEALRGAPGGDRRPGLHLVEDQLRAVLVAELADPLQVALARRDDVDVHHRRLDDQAGDLARVALEDPFEDLGVVEGDRSG